MSNLVYNLHNMLKPETKQLIFVLVLVCIVFVALITVYKILNKDYSNKNQIKPSGLGTSLNVNKPIDRINNDEILKGVNKYREEKGKPTLQISKQLCDYAEFRADFLWKDDMAEIKNTKTGSHSKSKEHLKEWVLAGKLKAGFIDEDIAGNAENSQDVVQIWKDLPTHNISILRTEYQGYPIKYACVATREASDSNLTILILGDK